MPLNLSLRTKILCLTLFFIASFSLITGTYVKTQAASHLTEEVLKRGISIARHLAEVSAETVIQRDLIHLRLMLENAQQAETDISYIFIASPSGKQVLAHSFGESFPVNLLEVHSLSPGQEYSIKALRLQGQTTYDILLPILDKRGGYLHLGISGEPVQQAITQVTTQALIFLVVLTVIAALIAIPVSRTITRPIASLQQAVEALKHGDRNLRVEISQRDEIGLLGEAFNELVMNLKDVENRLDSQRNFLEVLLDNIPSPVFYKDLQKRMLGCNRAFGHFIGLPIEEIIGKLPEDMHPLDAARLHISKDDELIRAGGVVSYEFTLQVDAEKQQSYLCHKTLFNGEDGKPAGIIGVLQDITQQREAVRLKSEFVSTMAHEFQTPLATILGYSELINNKLIKGKQREESQALIAEKAEYLSHMVSELLDLSRIEAGRNIRLNLEPCDVNEAVKEIINSFSGRTPTHRFSCNLPESSVVIAADKPRMSQVLENILSNAVKYSPAGSTVQVDVQRGEEQCQVRVTDPGGGMTPEQVSYMFEKFYRADSSNTAPAGTGLGLFISKSIVLAHHGKIWAESEPGVGTTVYFALPFRQPEAREAILPNEA